MQHGSQQSVRTRHRAGHHLGSDMSSGIHRIRVTANIISTGPRQLVHTCETKLLGLSIPHSIKVRLWSTPSNLHFRLVIDKLQSFIVQPLASLQILNQRVDWLSPALIVMIDCQAEGPCLSEWSVRSSSVPGTPVPVPSPQAYSHPQCQHTCCSYMLLLMHVELQHK